MAWPRNKNPRSSARPGTPERATATPAPDAEPAPGSGGPSRIRYGHSGETDISPDAASPDTAPHDTAPHDTAPHDTEPTDHYDEIAGLVYEVPQSAHPGGYGDAPAGPADDGAGPADGGAEPADGGASGRSTDEGLAIFGPAPPAEPPTAELSPKPANPADATRSQPTASAAETGGADGGSKRRTFGIRVPGLDDLLATEDGQPRIAVRELPPDVQLRFWRLRATIMVVTGLLFLLLTKNWVIALTLAILAGVIDTLYRMRYAANYQNGASQAGARRRTRRQLTRMRRAGYFALEARPIPNSREFIDHLVIGPTGVYAIDSEKWDPKLPIRTANGKRLFRGPESQKARLEHAVWEATQASEILSGALRTEIKVRPALAIYGPKVPWDIATIRNVDVFTGSALRKYLKQRSRMRGETPRLTREQVRTIYDTAARMLPDVAPSKTTTPVG